MKKRSSLFVFAIAAIVIYSTCFGTEQSEVKTPGYKIDTLYYDNEWKECPVAAFAFYRRIVITPEDSIYVKKFRTHYIPGGLQEEGNFLSTGRLNESLVRDGKCTTYYRSGKIEEEGFFAHGVQNGECTKYYENGLIKVRSYFVDGRLDGIQTRFDESGEGCSQCEFSNGEPKNTYYTATTAAGFTMKFNLSDDSPVLDTPNPNERREMYQNGVAWDYYIKNGITLGVSIASIKDYGRYIQVTVYLENNSPLTFDFDPTQIEVQFVRKTNKDLNETPTMPALSSAQYMKIVKRRQNWNEAMTGLAMGLSAAASGYSSATVTTSARASYGGNTIYGSARSHVTAYDGAAAFQAGILAGNYIDNYAAVNQKARAVRNEGYLKKTTLFPGYCIVGYVNICKVRADAILVRVPVNTIDYDFVWGFKK